MSFASSYNTMLRKHFPLVILLLSLLFAAHDYHAGLQTDETAICEAESCFQEAEAEGVWFPAAHSSEGLSASGLGSTCFTPIFYRLQDRQGFTPFSGRRIYLQYRQLRCDC